MEKIKINKWLKSLALIGLACVLLITFTGCVKQSPKDSTDGRSSGISSKSGKDLIAIEDPVEKAAVEEAREKVKNLGREPRIVATSAATADICEKLGLDLVGVCETTVSVLPEKYKNVKKVGMPMAPDVEILASVKPDWVLSPVSLQGDLQPKYDAMKTDWGFLNLSSVPGMYRSIQELGMIFGKEAEADKMVSEFNSFYEKYKKKNEGKTKPKVLILMGLPGSYIIATENSYVGSLVELAGGENVYGGTNKEFLNVNTEDMKTKNPDIILRTAHALPDNVIAMFKKDFEENDIWKHFDAVKKGQVFDLTYSRFGMSAKFNYPEALEELQPILYPENDADRAKAKQNSDDAGKSAEKSNGSAKYDEIMKNKK
ncbi:MAG: heme ABC transporter substrate-binding protein IsdE [Clostridiales bacterium]|nr:heme ABC transporter substrate-binding protein IsdE [Clostridiales bacterium]MBS5878246.1 heme ABC transporter substrate-binding protein IsdE [Clostridiales bacterium]MDU0939571.1 heme ABC transporter substrate-binding protein IsdE [Clostridiales bacterium]MDU1041421.1 heme ABC transporter substrate-binding protein IsdE [Clostridiales bacterium]MDU3489693.1 heme ABC transporter substrate-binding protein IsdE [Clostridiales bacterium]